MKFIFSVVLLFAFGFQLFGQEQVKGFVFEDLNNNGVMDANEPGLANVGVSNGIEVVRTNENGAYTLPMSEERVIFVIKPSTHAYPLDDTNIPQFYYVHRPEGSPETLRYRGLSATGELPASLDFPLLPADKKTKFRMLVFGDPQPYTEQELAWFDKAIVQDVTDLEGVEFGVSVGDIVGDDLSLFPGYRKVMNQLGLPWYNVLGNHDINYDGTDGMYITESFQANFGPTTYSFNHGDVHVLILDDILYPDPRTGRGYWGGFRENQLAFIENDLKNTPKDKLVMLFMHIPLFNEGGGAFRVEDREKLLNLLSEFPHSVSFSAHTHYMKQTFLGKEEGFLREEAHHQYNIGTPSGDWYSGKWNEEGIPESTMRDGSPKGYVYVDIDGVNYSTRYKAAGKDPGYQMSIFAPKVVEEGKRNRDRLVVNFFTGSTKDQVHYRVGEGDWLPLRNFEDVDPTYLMKYFEWDLTEKPMAGRRPSYPVRTNHLWSTTLLLDRLPTGTHTIEVKAVDMFGQEHFGTREIQIVKP
jgi:hypothetical protein